MVQAGKGPGPVAVGWWHGQLSELSPGTEFSSEYGEEPPSEHSGAGELWAPKTLHTS